MTKKPSDEAPTNDTGDDVYDFLPHPLAETYPLMVGDEFDALVKDIEENGLIDPITLHDGKILDGRNRYNACQKIKHKFGKFNFRNLPTDKDPLIFVISKNSARRHLTAEQKREVIAKLLAERPNASSRLIASIARVSHHTVEDVRQKLEPAPAEPTPENPTGQSAQLPGTPPPTPAASPRTGLDGKTRSASTATTTKSKGKKPLTTIKTNLPLVTDTASQKEVFDLLFDQVGKKKIKRWTLLKETDDDEDVDSSEAPASPPN